jgi:hypothetical protein
VICINNPPLLGPFASAGTIPSNFMSATPSDFVEAIIGEQGANVFAHLAGYTTPFLVRPRAVAGLFRFNPCMIALNTSGIDLQNNGNVDLELQDCAFASNSTTNDNPNQSIRFNGGVIMNAAAITTAGGLKLSGTSNTVSPPVATFAQQVSDPLGTLVFDPSWGATCQPSPVASTTLRPGLYGGSCPGATTTPINMDSGNTYTLCPGIYVLDGRDNQHNALVIAQNGTTVQMGTAGAGGCPANGQTGVTFVATALTDSCHSGTTPPQCGGAFAIGGTGSNTPTVTLTGQPNALGTSYPILMYQVRNTADPASATTLAGGSAVSLTGWVYTPATPIIMTGSPNYAGCNLLIAASFTVSGNATMSRPTGCAPPLTIAKVIMVE